MEIYVNPVIVHIIRQSARVFPFVPPLLFLLLEVHPEFTIKTVGYWLIVFVWVSMAVIIYCPMAIIYKAFRKRLTLRSAVYLLMLVGINLPYLLLFLLNARLPLIHFPWIELP